MTGVLLAVMKRSLAVLVALAASLSLVSCSSSPPSTSVTVGSSSATAGTSSLTAGAYPAADVCAYLTHQLPALKVIGTPVGAHANLVGNLFGFLQSNAITADSGALDVATKAECPQVRTEVLAVTGLTSFAEL